MAVRAAEVLAILLGLASSASAEECRLALVLALDISGSVDVREDRLQRTGLARALLAPEVVHAFVAGDPVALYAFEWSSEATQTAFLPSWQIVRSEEDLVRIASALVHDRSASVDEPGVVTALGAALVHAAEALQAGPICRARTVDVSGDGLSNSGLGPGQAYASGSFDSVTVNALVITSAEPIDPWQNEELVAYFEAEVLHGPSAFLIVADDYEDYERAMTAKLLRELQALLASRPIRVVPGA